MNHAKLGRLAKLAHPGTYDDYTDEELGEDLAEEGYTEADFQSELVPMGNTSLSNRADTTSRSIESICLEAERKAREAANVPSWFLERKIEKQEKQNKLILYRIEEVRSLLTLARQLDEVRSQEINRQNREIQNRVLQAKIALDMVLTKEAAALGMSIPNYETYIARKIEIDAQIVLIQASTDIQVDAQIRAKKAEADIDVQTTKEKARIEYKKEKKLSKIRRKDEKQKQKRAQRQIKFEAEAEIIFGNRATVLLPYEQIKIVQREIDKLNARIEQIDQISSPTDMVILERKKLKRRVKVFYEGIRVIEEGLYKTNHGQKSKGSAGSAARNPRDAR